jgi:hypothetical protein
MRVGTKSLLFGVHQFIWHPITVFIAWRAKYGWPSWREVVCIVVHDWGYWGAPNMDGAEGERHPELGAHIAMRLFGAKYRDMCLHHSRHYCRQAQAEPSKLCWADKLSICYDPWWLYIPRAMLSGEINEYRQLAASAGFVPLSATHREWFRWVQDLLRTVGQKESATAVPYVNPEWATQGEGR